MAKPLFVYSDELLNYRFRDDHPFNQKRIRLTVDLLEQMGLLATGQVVAPKKATEADIARVHSSAYIEEVKKWSGVNAEPERSEDTNAKSKRAVSKGSVSSKRANPRFGLGTSDTPAFPGMHDSAAWVVGATLLGAEYIMEGETTRALHLGGGLHHAMAGKASGFCIYNDCSIVIDYLRETYNARVLYIDTDAHHGDGVQYTFDADPHVFTFSIHETGQFLFPGTGHVDERGFDAGYGTCLNVPMEPFTEDDSWLQCFRQSLEAVCELFRPDIIVSQHGCDAHLYDPLTHLALSMQSYWQMPEMIKQAAEQYTGGKWLALGGGGYDWYRVVPRAWSLLWMVMNDVPVKQQRIPESWRAAWQAHSERPLPTHLLDTKEDMYAQPRRAEIEERNEMITKRALQYIYAQLGKK